MFGRLPIWARSFGAGAPTPVLVSANYTVFDALGLDTITLTGTDLDSATNVIVDPGGPQETFLTINSNTSTDINVTTPGISPGTYDVVVVTAGGTSNALSLEASPTAPLLAELGDVFISELGDYLISEA